MARKIRGAVRSGAFVFKAGDERKLSDFFINKKTDAAHIKKLEEKGVITGFSSGDDGEVEGLPTVRELREHISSLSREEVEEMARGDNRVSAVEIYEARLNEIDAGV